MTRRSSHSLITLQGIQKRYAGVHALTKAHFELRAGEVHALMGENGAGKSTAMRIAYGFYTPDAGEILVEGQVREIKSPHDAIALGIGFTVLGIVIAGLGYALRGLRAFDMFPMTHHVECVALLGPE